MSSAQTASTSPQQWIVLEGDWGGQVYATIPVHLMPAWARRKRIRKALRRIDRLNWKQSDGTSVYVIQDFGPIDTDTMFAGVADNDEATALILAQEALTRAQETAPRGVLVEYTYAEPLDWPDSVTHVHGWKMVGGVTGGMGGGYLLQNEIWLHPHILARGLDEVNHVRTILGVAPLTSLCVRWSRDSRQHAEFCNHYSDCHMHRRRPSRGHRARVVSRRR